MGNAEKLASFGKPRDVRDIERGIFDSFVDEYKESEVQKKTFSPSRLAWGAGGCPRNWYFLFNGVNSKETVTSFARNNMRNGSDSHARMQDQILAGPLEAVCEEQLQYNDPPINSYCDVIVEYEGQRVPIEIKTANNTAYEYRELTGIAADYHILQLLIYMYILQSDLGFIMYENKNDYRKMLIPVRMTSEHKKIIQNAIEWMRKTRKAYDENTMPMYFSGRRVNSKICKDCPIKEECDSAGEGDVYIPLLKDFSV